MEVDASHDLPAVRDWVNDHPLARALHLSCREIAPGRASFELDPPEAWRNPNGSVAGAAVLAAADFAAGMASVSVTGREDDVSTVDLGLHFLRPALAVPLDVTCTVLRTGGRLVVLRADVHDADGELVATGQGSFAVTRGAGAEYPIGPRPGP